MKIALVILSFFIITIIPGISAESVPDWVKNTAGWWAEDAISETEFVNAIEYLANEGIIVVESVNSSKSNVSVPDWVKNTAGWWAEDAISETEFVNAIEYLASDGIINIESQYTSRQLAEMWKKGNFSDELFLKHVRNVSGEKYFESSTNLDIPDWLTNNAGWVSARIITNSNFNFDSTHLNEEIFPCFDQSIDVGCLDKTINSHGFRGPEFSKEKNEVDFRIFAVGGSTTYGAASSDGETWPSHLQQIINSEILNKKIEVINAGISAANSKSELELIKYKIINFQPDLIIIYDGWNDWSKFSATDTIQNWKSICELGNNNGFDTIITVQPLPSTGNRVLTEQEIVNIFKGVTYPAKAEQYVESFDNLKNYCFKTVDFRGIFDYVQEPVYWDDGHTMSNGNQIIAQNMFSIISPIYFEKEYSIIENVNYEIMPYNGDVTIYAAGADLSGRDFSKLDLTGAIFDKANLSNTDFINSNLNEARFVFSDMDNSNILDRTELKSINLAGMSISNFNLNDKDLSYSNLSYVDLSDQDLSGTILEGAKLSHTKFKSNTLNDKDLSYSNLSYVDLSDQDLSGMNLSETFLFRTNLSNKDLRYVSISNADFRYANLSGAILPNLILTKNEFDHSNLSNIDFSGKSLSYSSFEGVEIKNSNFDDTIFEESTFIGVDFSKIKNKTLKNSNMNKAAFSHSNFVGVDLPMDMFSIVFSSATLNEVDFSKRNIMSSYFGDSHLQNTNFEDSDLRGIEAKRIIKNGVGMDLIELKNSITPFPLVQILNVIPTGNDVTLEVLFYNNFINANLSNSNMKNADFYYADFTDADLSNVDLSNSILISAYMVNTNLKNTNLEGANLEGANLEGANLEGANLEGANLNCINNEICNQ